MSKINEAEREEAITRLNGWIKPGDTLYTVLRHVSQSKTMRRISVIKFADRILTLDRSISALGIGSVTPGTDGIRVSGFGQDMGFSIVYDLGRALYPHGYPCTGEGCRSNDHANGDRDYTPHTHKDGGYAFKHEWI